MTINLSLLNFDLIWVILLFKKVMTLDEKAKEVGSRIFQMRKALGLTQEKLAELSDIFFQFLVDIEHGNKT